MVVLAECILTKPSLCVVSVLKSFLLGATLIENMKDFTSTHENGKENCRKCNHENLEFRP
jgi:hypothetical protein